MKQAAGTDTDGVIFQLAKGRPGRAIALKAQGGREIAALLATRSGGIGASIPELYEKLGGEPFERLASVIEIAEDWVHGKGVEEGGEHWAEAWSQLETLRSEAEGLDMDPRHALARAVGILDRAAGARR